MRLMTVPGMYNKQGLGFPFVWAAYWVNGKIGWLSDETICEGVTWKSQRNIWLSEAKTSRLVFISTSLLEIQTTSCW